MRANVRGGFGQLVDEAVHVGGGHRRPRHPAGVPDPVGYQADIPHVGDGGLSAQSLGQLKYVYKPAPQPLSTARARSTRAVPVTQFDRISQPAHVIIRQLPPSSRPAIRTRGPPPAQQLIERPRDLLTTPPRLQPRPLVVEGIGIAVVRPPDHRLGVRLVGVARWGRAC